MDHKVFGDSMTQLSKACNTIFLVVSINNLFLLVLFKEGKPSPKDLKKEGKKRQQGYIEDW